MILTENVRIFLTNRNIKYYEKIGYKTTLSEYINVNITDLPSNSNIFINCKCDICFHEKRIKYQAYFKNFKNQNIYCCSRKCANFKFEKNSLEKYGTKTPLQNDIIKNKIIQTNLEKYGYKNPMQNEKIKKKSIQTSIEKYGCKNPMQNENIKEKNKKKLIEKYGVDNISNVESVKQKKKKSNLIKWGTECTLQNEKIKDLVKITNVEKYGFDNPSKNEFIKNKIKHSKNKNTIEKYQKKLDNKFKILDYNDTELKILDVNNNNIFFINLNLLYDRIKLSTEISTILNPINQQTSGKEIQLINWLKELNITFKESDRDILEGKELDIYIPSKNIAIEFNGLYWHSENFKHKNYHLEKSLKCQEKGIQLLHIWEDEWVYKQEIVKSIILNKLNLISEKIYARQCEIRVIEDSKLVRQFLDENHIQGYSQSSIKLGLYYKNELVSLMTFGYRHTNAKKEFELIRFCNRINLNVIGSASKLFNYFKQNYHFTELISYSDFRLFDGKMYETLGFEKKHLSKPDYFWCKNIERKHRFNFNKQKLIKEGFDGSKTEVEIMHDRGYFRVFGCGQYRWIFKNTTCKID
jgi:hypothetical protein